jgi:hypothetical protein
MAKLFSLAALVVGGVIVADIWIHPAGTQAASQGAQGIEKPALNALLGTSS